MDYIQLDKNTGDKRLRDSCMKEGIVRCDLLPANVRDEEDDIVLNFIIERNYVIFTFDKQIHFDWGVLLAGRNPGILILRQDDDSLEQINTRRAPIYLKQFKSEFPEWNKVSYRNSVVEVTPKYVFVYRTIKEVPERTWWGNRSEEGWQSKLMEQLATNAACSSSLNNN
jgi:predicted nuclease of predicted toxin-antitoxin system